MTELDNKNIVILDQVSSICYLIWFKKNKI